MATQVCEECNAVYTVTPELSGQPHRCSKCASRYARSKDDLNATAEILIEPAKAARVAETPEAAYAADVEGAEEDLSKVSTVELSRLPAPPQLRGKGPVPGPGPETLPRAPEKRIPGAPKSVSINHQLGPYRIVAEIGRGGMGIVLKARDDALKREVAIKALLPEARKNPTHELRFIQEAQIAGQLEHPGIAPVHLLSWDEQGNGYFSMKLVTGKSLEHILERWHTQNAETRAEFPLTRLISIFERVCETIGYAHSHRVVHRDLKPANIMIGDYGEVLVLDWGLAKVLGDDSAPDARVKSSKAISARELREAHEPRERAGRVLDKDLESNVTLDGTVVGTPGYMAPEQASGDDIDEGVDIFGLGGLLYEILTGNTPYTGRSIQEIIVNSAKGRVNPIPRKVHGRTVAPALVAIANKCLERRRQDRYADTAALIRDLRAFAAGETVSALAYSPFEQVTRFARRHRRVLSWAGAAGAVALSVLIYLLAAVWRQDVIAREERDKRLQAEVDKNKAQADSVETERQARQAEKEKEQERTQRLQAELDKQTTLNAEAKKASSRLKAFEPYSQAMDLLMRGQLPDSAAELLKRALKLDPDFEEAQFALGQALQFSGLPAEAAAAYLKADELNQALTGKPNLQALIAAGFTFDGAGYYAKAEDAFTRADKLGASDPLAVVGRVYQATNSRHTRQAIQLAQEALRVAPHLWETHFAYAEAMFEAMKDGVVPRVPTVRNAIDELRKANELSPRQAEVCVWLAIALSADGQTDDARIMLDRAIALEPRNGNRYLQRYLSTGKRPPGDAEKDLEKARSLGASEAYLTMCEAHKAMHEHNPEQAYLCLGKLLKETRDWPSIMGEWIMLGLQLGHKAEVLPASQRWCQKNPEYYMVHVMRAQQLAPDIGAAMREIDEGLKSAPYSAMLHTIRAELFIAMKNYKDALDSTEKALDSSPYDFTALYYKDVALSGMERNSEAQALLKKLKADFPERTADLTRLETQLNQAHKN